MKRILLILLCLLLTGCARSAQPAVRFVTQITITDNQGGSLLVAPQDMSPILNALRSTGNRFPPAADPDALDLPSCRITLTHSDGLQTHWQIKGNCYIRQEPAPWQQTDPKQITALTDLLREL